MKKFLVGLALLTLLGAGCASAPVQPPVVPQDATPGVNESNCTKSGGTVQADNCVCPDEFIADPAGFCLDAAGKPGGEMGQK